MTSEHLHRQLTPDSARFCPLCGGALLRRPVPPEGKPENVCAGCGFVFYLNHKVVAGTIVAEDGRVLLTRRSIHPGHGKWTVPSGFVDWGEAVEVVGDLKGQVWRDVETRTITSGEYKVYYASQCWGVGLSYMNKPGETQYLVLLDLKGLGGMKF